MTIIDFLTSEKKWYLLEVTTSHLVPNRPQNINLHKYIYMGDLTIVNMTDF